MGEVASPVSVLVIELAETACDVVRQALMASGVIGFEEAQPCDDGRLRWMVWCSSGSEAQRHCDALRIVLAANAVASEVTCRIERRDVGNWETAWLADLVPVQLTPSVRVDPTPAARPDAHTLVLEPAVAFGHGEHPSTQLAARHLEGACGARRRPRVLDVGTGSGVLTLVAARSGASVAVGVDLSLRAVEAARRNALLNGLNRAEFYVGSAEQRSDSFDIVVANIEASVLLALSAALAARLAPLGSLILSGFVDTSVGDLRQAYADLGFREARRGMEAEWVCLELERD